MSTDEAPIRNARLASGMSAWIGRSTERMDVVTARMAECFTATLAPHLAPQSGSPLGIFWCLAPDIVTADGLGADGHPRPGRFIPAMPYPRRMWAGGDLAFHDVFEVGDLVTKTSSIEDIAFKTGRTGQLAFLTMRHHYRVGGRLVLDERQDIVYRDAVPLGGGVQRVPEVMPLDPAATSWTVAIDPTLLFRYSALTFNGHRIHYDRPYATEAEGYDGLVVHGPLQATLMLNLAAATLGRTPGRFRYRGRAPLICDGTAVRVEVVPRHEPRLALQVLSAEGTATMIAEAEAAGI